MNMPRLFLKFYDFYNFVMDHNRNPLRHVQDPVARMWLMIVLAWMWSIAFGLYFASVYYIGLSLIGHLAILFMVFFTAGVFYDAERNNEEWLIKLRRESHN